MSICTILIIKWFWILQKLLYFQFSLIQKRENAHSEGIWACDWGHYIPKENEAMNGDANGEEHHDTDDKPKEEVG